MTGKKSTMTGGGEGKGPRIEGDEYNDLTLNLYAEVAGRSRPNAPSPAAIRARLIAQVGALLQDGAPEYEILFNLFDEMYTLAKKAVVHGDEMLYIELAREAAFTRTARFRGELYSDTLTTDQGRGDSTADGGGELSRGARPLRLIGL